MAKITVTATRTIEQTITTEIKVRIADVKQWLLENYGPQHGHDWNDSYTLQDYFQSNLELIDEDEGNIDDLSDDWDVQSAEEM